MDKKTEATQRVGDDRTTVKQGPFSGTGQVVDTGPFRKLKGISGGNNRKK